MIRPVLLTVALAASPVSFAAPDACDVNGAFTLSEPLTQADVLFEGEARNQQSGRALLNMDINGDGFEDLLIGVPGAKANGPGTGRVELRYGPLDDHGGSEDSSTSDAVFVGPYAGLEAGYSLANAGDIDGDGFDDLIIGSNAGATSAYPGGVAWVMYGGDLTGLYDLEFADATLEGSESGAGFGRAVVGLGNFDGLGGADFAVAAPNADVGGADAGSVHLFTSPPIGVLPVDVTATARFYGTATSRAGLALHGADMDLDGRRDLLIGAPRDNTGGSRSGSVFVVPGGSWSADQPLETVSSAILRGDTYARAGSAIATGDIDGDGYLELYVGSPLWGSSKRGAVDVIAGGPALTGTLTLSAVAEAHIKGVDAYDAFGSSIAAGTDLDGDGRPDVVVGAMRADAPHAAQSGAAWVLTQELSGNFAVSATEGARYGSTRSSFAGAAVALFDDLNNDGVGDFVIGAWQANATTGTRRAGQVATFWGGLDLSDEETWYVDADGDGWGEPTAIVACAQPPGTVDRAGDCNDADPVVYPYAPETVCSDPTDYNCDGLVGLVDLDGDGIAACEGDCDDSDPAVSPIETEICGDDVDNDCDLAVDDGSAIDALLWSPDADGDGDGNRGIGVMACEDPGIFLTDVVHTGGDCNDDDPAVSQFAVEICDGIDNNCSDGADESTAVDAQTWYADADGDGYGDAANHTRACAVPAGHLGVAGDCGDDDPSIRPGAAELCNALDDDCDTLFYSGGEHSLAVDPELRLTGAAGESLGRAMTAVADWDSDGRDELLLGAPAHSSLATDAGAVYIRSGREAVETVDLSAVHQGGRTEWRARIRAERARSRFGEAVVTGDFNGDGIEDVVVGAPGQARPQVEQGVVFVFYGPISGDLTTESADLWFSGVDVGDELGAELAMGDLDGDGWADLVVGAPDEDGSGDRMGAVHIVYGGSTYTSGPIVDAADATLRGVADKSSFGISVTGGDFNADGLVDLVVGASRQPSLEAGAVHVYLGKTHRWSGELAGGEVVFQGVGAGDRVGLSVAGVGDVDGDGAEDLLVGSAGNEAYLIGGGTWSSGRVTDHARTTFEGVSLQRLGSSVAAAGDVNRDGYGDLLISASDDDTRASNAGAAALIYGGPGMPATLDTTQLAHRAKPETDGVDTVVDVLEGGEWEGAVFYGETANEQAGRFVAAGGDFNGDGAPDVLIGNHRADGGAGAVSAVYGGGYGLDVLDPALATWSSSLGVDGSSEEWSEQVRFGTTTGHEMALTWDDTHVYVGVASGLVGAGSSSHVFVLYFGNADGNGLTEGRTVGTQQASLPFAADRYLTWTADNSYNSWDVYDGSGFVRTEGWFDGSSLVENNANGVVEFAIPRAELGNPGTLKVAGLWYFDVAGTEVGFGGFPADSFTDQPDPDLSSWFEFSLDRTTAPAEYGSLPFGGGLTTVEDRFDTWWADLDGDGTWPTGTSSFDACPMHVPISPFSGKRGATTDALAFGDCDDLDIVFAPNAADEVGDGGDQNCDGVDGSHPVVTSCELAPGEVATDGVVSASSTATDVDNEPVALSYQWRVDGTIVSGQTGDTLDGAWFSRDEQVEVFCVANDAQGGEGVELSSDTQRIVNSQPVITQCVVGPTAPGTTDALVAISQATDADGDSLVWSYAWRVNGVVDTSVATSVYPAAGTAVDDVIEVQCMVTDLDKESLPLNSASVVVENKLPTAPTVGIAGPVFEGNPLYCEVVTESTDADGDVLDYVVTWLRNGVEFAGPRDTTQWPGDTIPAEEVTAGVNWECSVEARDGLGAGPPGVSNTINPLETPTTKSLLAAGDEFTCAVLDGGELTCWGRGQFGLLGNGSTGNLGRFPGQLENQSTIDLGTHAKVAQVTAGRYHVCAMLVSGEVKCWGRNDHGQLGLGDVTNRGASLVDMGDALPALDFGPGLTARQVDAHWEHTCARLSDGSVKCWGNGDAGALGHGDTFDLGSSLATTGAGLPVVDLGTGRYAVDIAVGYGHSCALLDNGDVKCWGLATAGQTGHGNVARVGDDPGEMGDALPVTDFGSGQVVDLEASHQSTCALFDDGRVVCLGRGAEGQLGNGAGEAVGDQPGELGNNLVAVDLGVGRTAQSITAGSNHVCALLDDDRVKCWGAAGSGQLGLGSTEDMGNEPMEMGSFLPSPYWHSGSEAVGVVAGDSHTCAVDACGQLHCWGSNVRGELGVGDSVGRGSASFEMGDALPRTVLPTGRTVGVGAEPAECSVWSSPPKQIDGDLGDWSGDEVFVTGSADQTVHVSWDSDRVYLAVDSAIPMGPTESMVVYLGNSTDDMFTGGLPGHQVGYQLGGTRPWLGTYSQSVVVWDGDAFADIYKADWVAGVETWTYIGEVGALSGEPVAYNPGSNTVEMTLPRRDLDLYAHQVMTLQSAVVDWDSSMVRAALPPSSFAEGDVDPSYSTWLRFVLDSPVGPVGATEEFQANVP